MKVTRNWRLTFTLTQTGSVTDMNLEDYHGS
jgi:plasmid maintenance system killer protein